MLEAKSTNLDEKDRTYTKEMTIFNYWDKFYKKIQRTKTITQMLEAKTTNK